MRMTTTVCTVIVYKFEQNIYAIKSVQEGLSDATAN